MLQLVCGDHDLVLRLNFPSEIEDQLSRLMALERQDQLEESNRPSQLAALIVDAITEIVEPGASPPTDKQLRYAMAVASTLRMHLPAAVLKDRKAMRVFLDLHADTFRQHRQWLRRQRPA